jgi:hypothetical protein
LSRIVLIIRANECHRAILDGALRFTTIQGKAIMFGFADREELKEWGKMHLPNNQALKQKVAQMESSTIGVNFDFDVAGEDAER